MHGRDFVAAVSGGVAKGLRLAYCPDIAGVGVDPHIEAVCWRAALGLTQLAATVEEVSLDLAFGRDAFLALRGHWFVSWMFERLHRIEKFGVNVRNNTNAGLTADTRGLGAAEHARGRMWHLFREFFGKFDHLLTPTMAVPPFPVEQNYPQTVAGKVMKTYVDWIAPTFILSLTGLPVASVPCGKDPEGMPVGLQIVGQPRGEEAVLALAAAVQKLNPVGLPPL